MRIIVFFTLGLFAGRVAAQTTDETFVPLPGSEIPMPLSGQEPDDGNPVSNMPADRVRADFKNWDLRGYLEDTFTLEHCESSDRILPLNGTRMRINLEGKPSQRFDFGIGVIGTLFSGRTSIGMAQYLPDDVRLTLFPGDPDEQLPAAAELLVYEFENRIYLQEAFATLNMPYLRIRVGRHKIYAGTGFAYNPVDLFTQKDPLDPTYEVDGLDALVTSVELPAQTTIEGTVLLDDEFELSDYRLVLKTHLAGWDLAFHFTHHIRHRVNWQELTSPEGIGATAPGAPVESMVRRFRWQLIAAELSGELLGVGVHAEGGWAFVEAVGDAGSLAAAGRDHERLLVGLDYTFDFQLYVLVEYMRLGQGRGRPGEIELNDRLAWLTGEILAIDRDTVFSGVSYPLSDLTELAVYTIVGIDDPSAIVNPWLLVDLYQGVRLSFSVFLPLGCEQGTNGRASAGGFARVRFSF